MVGEIQFVRRGYLPDKTAWPCVGGNESDDIRLTLAKLNTC